MPATRTPGMDQAHYDWSPMVSRPVLRWPDNARVALSPFISLEHFEWNLPADAFMPPNTQRMYHPPSTPWSLRQYGLRVGIFNIMEVLDKYGLKATVAIDAVTAENYPVVVEECKKRGYEFVAHGLTAQRIISSAMTEQQEREYIRTSLKAVEQATGSRPSGWFSMEYSESARTPELLADEGMRYVCDFPNDEQPYKMKSKNAYFLPMLLELDDMYNVAAPRFLPVTEFCQMMKDSFDTLYADGAKNGRVLTMNLHPHLMGQPFRVKYLDIALGHMLKRGGVWNATGGQIIDWYAKQK